MTNIDRKDQLRRIISSLSYQVLERILTLWELLNDVVECRAALDSCASHTFVPAGMLDKLKKESTKIVITVPVAQKVAWVSDGHHLEVKQGAYVDITLGTDLGSKVVLRNVFALILEIPEEDVMYVGQNELQKLGIHPADLLKQSLGDCEVEEDNLITLDGSRGALRVIRDLVTEEDRFLLAVDGVGGDGRSMEVPRTCGQRSVATLDHQGEYLEGKQECGAYPVGEAVNLENRVPRELNERPDDSANRSPDRTHGLQEATDMIESEDAPNSSQNPEDELDQSLRSLVNRAEGITENRGSVSFFW